MLPSSPQKYSGIDGIGWVQTSSPTSSITGWPCSFQASTAQPSRRHCISPGTCGSSRLPPMKAPAKSVPPEMLHHQMSGVPSLRELLPCPSAAPPRDSGEPVVPSARTRDRSPQCGQVDAGLHAVGEEGRAGAEEGDAQLGGEAPQHASSRACSLRAAGVAVVDAAGGAVQQAAGLRVPHHPAGGAVPVVALAPAVGVVAAADVVVQRLERQRHQHGAAVAVHDRLGQAGGAAGVDDPQRVVEGQPERLEGGRRGVVSRDGLRHVGPAATSASSAASPRPGCGARSGAARWAARRAARPPRRRGRSRARRSCTPSQAISTLGSICRKRSSTALVPMSGAQMLQTPPMLTTARKATMVSGMLGR